LEAAGLSKGMAIAVAVGCGRLTLLTGKPAPVAVTAALLGKGASLLVATAMAVTSATAGKGASLLVSTAVTATAGKSASLLVATAVTVAATASEEGRSAAAAAAPAPVAATSATASRCCSRRRGGRTATSVRIATAAIAMTLATTASSAVGTGIYRGCDRQRGDAGSEKHPGQHEKSPSERDKRPVGCTVPTLERVEPAL